MREKLASYTRHKCFISYHHEDEDEVKDFVNEFDHSGDILISRGIGAGMAGDIIDSSNDDYIKSRIRDLYLRNSSVTIVLVGRCTWARQFVDWEVAASLRNTSTANRNGLMAVALPSITGDYQGKLPKRVADNVNGDHGYAQWWQYPADTSVLADCIQQAYDRRTSHGHLVKQAEPLRRYNLACT